MHLEALTDKGRKIFPLFVKLPQEFYLAGGTALALQIGHRISVDFDFFSSDYIPKEFLSKVKKIFSDFEVQASVNNPEELTVFVRGVKVTFLRYPFPVIEKFVDFDSVKMLSAIEIAATKAYTVGRRGSLKDYLDIYFILQNSITILDDIIGLAEKKYGNDFNSRLFLEQLVYLEDIPDEPIKFLRKPVSQFEIAEFFQKRIKEIKL